MKTKEQVWDALNRGHENAPWISKMKPTELAIDLIAYDSDFEDCEVDDVLPHVKSWLEQ